MTGPKAVQPIETTVTLEPGRYVFSASSSQDTYNFVTQGPNTLSSTYAARFELRVTEQPPPCPEPWYALSMSGQDLALQDLSQLDDLATMAKMRQQYLQAASRLKALSNAAAVLPGSVIDGPGSALEDLAINEAIRQAPARLQPILEALNTALSLNNPAVAVADQYLSEASHLLAAAGAIMEQYASGLPDAQFGLTDYGCFQPSDLDLLGGPNGPYGPLADALAKWRAGLEDLSLAGQALARASGAAQAGNSAAFEAQRRLFSQVLTSADTRFLDAANGLSQARSLFSAHGVTDSPADPQALTGVIAQVRANGLPPAIRAELAKLGLSETQITQVEAALANLDVASPTALQSQGLYDLADSIAQELLRDTARAQLSAATSAPAATVPASNLESLALLLLGLLAVGALSARVTASSDEPPLKL